MGNRLLMFTGRECTHCHAMDPLIEKLEKEQNVTITQLEVWHDAKNAAEMQKLDNGFCGGVPFFYNEKTGKKICGEVPFEKLKAWALGK